MHSLKRLGSMCDLVVVTSRQHVIRDSTLRWIDLHYPGIFKEVHFGNHWAMEGTSKPKSQICRWAAGRSAVGLHSQLPVPARHLQTGCEQHCPLLCCQEVHLHLPVPACQSADQSIAAGLGARLPASKPAVLSMERRRK